ARSAAAESRFALRLRHGGWIMQCRMLWLVMGAALGVVGSWMLSASTRPALAVGNDRFEDFILCTGPAAINANVPTDGVWLLDYRTGKLLATLIDRGLGKIG